MFLNFDSDPCVFFSFSAGPSCLDTQRARQLVLTLHRAWAPINPQVLFTGTIASNEFMDIAIDILHKFS